MVTLSKREKKVARDIIEKGLMKEYGNALSDAFNVLEKWKGCKKDNRESYHSLFRTVKKHDKHIARRYDYMIGSKYVFIIAGQFADGIISDDDLKEFREETRNFIRQLSESFK